jgi:hypothetical protein
LDQQQLLRIRIGFAGPSWRKNRAGGQPRMGPPEARLLD